MAGIWSELGTTVALASSSVIQPSTEELYVPVIVKLDDLVLSMTSALHDEQETPTMQTNRMNERIVVLIEFFI